MRRTYCLLRPLGDEIRVEASYDQAWNETLKRTIPRGDWRWDGAQYWFVAQQHRAALVVLAQAMTMAEWQDGAVTIDLHTGRVSEQLMLFGELEA
jgi:hypothetical protein